MLQQMDEEFGIGDLVEEEFGTKKRYGSKDLRGLRVEHGQDTFTEGKTVILTLKDRGNTRWLCHSSRPMLLIRVSLLFSFRMTEICFNLSIVNFY